SLSYFSRLPGLYKAVSEQRIICGGVLLTLVWKICFIEISFKTSKKTRVKGSSLFFMCIAHF
ncbi:MAG: hypothetical protein Q8929_08480, partial [Bacillota bacterium]|nr:hypothetical protein [Bacillota bacterium]